MVLTLKKKWYDMIASGEKTEEYREIKSYWCKRLLNCGMACGGWSLNGEAVCPVCRHLDFKPIRTVTFTLGYPKANDPARRMTFAVKDICFGEGRPEWGAEEETQYFVIKLGERIC